MSKEACGWCKAGYRIECYLIDDYGNTLSIKGYVVQPVIASYCPNCGRKMEVVTWNERVET